MAPAYSVSSPRPSSIDRIRSSRSLGRGKLPTCVVKMRSVLRFTGPQSLSDGSEPRRAGSTAQLASYGFGDRGAYFAGGDRFFTWPGDVGGAQAELNRVVHGALDRHGFALQTQRVAKQQRQRLNGRD